MRTIVLILNLLFFGVKSVSAQEELPLNNDTIICIVDTTNCFTSFRENPFEKNHSKHWQVSIVGHYYDNTEDEDFAMIVFGTDFRNNSWAKGDSVIFIPVSDVEENYTVVTDAWLNQQYYLSYITDKVGYTLWSNYNYLIFKQDLINSKDGFVPAHRVLYGYSEIQY